MKTLVNKNNPAFRITAPEIIEEEEYYTLDDETVFLKEYWTLIEEEPEKQTSKYLKEPDYDKQVVKKMSKELAKIITDQIAEPEDWEKMVEFNCIGKKVKMTIHELINYYIDSECADVADECGF